jgi:ATP-dependent DNA ligase
VLNRDASIPITFAAFDVLRMDGENMMDTSFEERRAALVQLPLPANLRRRGNVR